MTQGVIVKLRSNAVNTLAKVRAPRLRGLSEVQRCLTEPQATSGSSWAAPWAWSKGGLLRSRLMWDDGKLPLAWSEL